MQVGFDSFAAFDNALQQSACGIGIGGGGVEDRNTRSRHVAHIRMQGRSQ